MDKKVCKQANYDFFLREVVSELNKFSVEQTLRRMSKILKILFSGGQSEAELGGSEGKGEVER